MTHDGAFEPHQTGRRRPGFDGRRDPSRPNENHDRFGSVNRLEVRTEDGDRVFVMTVAVENGDEDGYELRLDALSTREGTTVSGGGRSDVIEAGGSAEVTGRWELPAGERPWPVIVVASLVPPEGDRETVTRRVNLAVEEARVRGPVFGGVTARRSQ